MEGLILFISGIVFFIFYLIKALFLNEKSNPSVNINSSLNDNIFSSKTISNDYTLKNIFLTKLKIPENQYSNPAYIPTAINLFKKAQRKISSDKFASLELYIDYLTQQVQYEVEKIYPSKNLRPFSDFSSYSSYKQYLNSVNHADFQNYSPTSISFNDYVATNLHNNAVEKTQATGNYNTINNKSKAKPYTEPWDNSLPKEKDPWDR